MFIRTRLCLRDEGGFFNQVAEDFSFVFQSGLQPKESESFFASLTQLYLTAPFGLENLRGCDTTAGVRVKDGVDDVAATGLDFVSLVIVRKKR